MTNTNRSLVTRYKENSNKSQSKVTKKIPNHLKGGRSLKSIRLDKELDLVDFAIMNCVANYCDLSGNFTDWVTCSINHLLDVTRLKQKRTLWNHINKLIEKGYLNKRYNFAASGRQLYNHYQITSTYHQRHIHIVNDPEKSNDTVLLDSYGRGAVNASGEGCVYRTTLHNEENNNNISIFSNTSKISNNDDLQIVPIPKKSDTDFCYSGEKYPLSSTFQIPKFPDSSRVVGMIFLSEWNKNGKTRWLSTKAAIAWVDLLIYKHKNKAIEYFNELVLEGIRYPFSERNKFEMAKAISNRS